MYNIYNTYIYIYIMYVYLSHSLCLSLSLSLSLSLYIYVYIQRERYLYKYIYPMINIISNLWLDCVIRHVLRCQAMPTQHNVHNVEK